MNRIAVFCVFVLIGSGMVYGQQTSGKSNPSQTSTQFVVNPVSRCPIGMHAMQGSSTQMLRADDGQVQHLMTPTLTLAPKDHRAIAKATVTARGYPIQAGTLDLVAHLIDPAHPQPKRKELEKTLTVKLSSAGTESNSFSAELQLPGFNILNSIELNSVTYADGSTWKIASQDDCRIAPDPLLLIANQ